MRFGRLVAASGVVSIVLAGGLYALAPEVHGQAKGKMKPKVAAGGATMSGEGQDAFELARASDGLAVLDAGGSRIGASVRDVDQADVTRQKLADTAGAVVDEVRSETPAAKAGLKAGDVVIGFDGERVRGARQLERLVDETPAGRTVKMSIVRTGATLALEITPESSAQAFGGDFGLPAFRGPRFHGRSFEHGSPGAAAPALPYDRDRAERLFRDGGFPATEFDFNAGGMPLAMVMGRSRLGVQVESVNDQLATYFGVERGALVRSVTDDSPAAKAGVKAGDVITAANGTPVKDAGDLRQALRDVEDGKAVTLSVTRDRKSLSLEATLAAPQPARTRLRRVV
jgi:serine protease Do